jgi:hypothetical protein
LLSPPSLDGFRLLSCWLAGLLLVAVLATSCSKTAASPPRALAVPTLAGINYGQPVAADGTWAGSQWLRSGTGHADFWDRVKGRFDHDLTLINQRHLGSVVRIFVGLDQLMVWDPVAGYSGFNQEALDNFDQALGMLDRHQIRAFVVLYDQEEQDNLGNFHFEALDGAHPRMRAGYLQATTDFMQRFGDRHTVIGWDLFNEAYNSLGTDGGLPRPPHSDPVSPNYPRAVVHNFLRDLYQAAKRGAPGAMFTVSDTTEIYWHNPPDLQIYDGVLDYYDIHVYDDRPAYPNWRAMLNKPYIVGEAGASTDGDHFEDQKLNPPALRYLLDQAAAHGVSAVLAHGDLLTSSGDLTPSGQVIAQFLSRSGQTPRTG